MQKHAILSKSLLTTSIMGYLHKKSYLWLSAIPLLISATMLLPRASYALDDSLRCSTQKGNVPRAMFTTDIDNREPVDRVLILDNSKSQIYFFSDLRHLQGQSIKHRWEFEGKMIQEKTFEVKGPRWRVYSLQDLDTTMLGRWTVLVTDEKGCPLRAVIFEYVARDDKNQTAAIIRLR